MLAFGDFGNGSGEQKMVAQTIVTYHQGQRFDFAITLGDNFYSVGMESPSDPRWKTWFEDLYGPLGIPFYASLGNHDWGHPDSPAAEILYSGLTPTWRMPAAYYTFTAGPVQFFALDTQSVALAQKQREWLDRELTTSQARWKVVYGHHPIYSDGNYEDRPDLIASLLPILANRVDAYICGHDHNLQALQAQRGVRFYIAGGGGAGLYEVTIAAVAVREPHERLRVCWKPMRPAWSSSWWTRRQGGLRGNHQDADGSVGVVVILSGLGTRGSGLGVNSHLRICRGRSFRAPNPEPQPR